MATLTFRLAVRAFAQQMHRSGDLFVRLRSKTRGVDGIRAHQKIQRQLKRENFRCEVPLGYVKEVAALATGKNVSRNAAHGISIAITLHGRADALRQEGSELIIEEIKSSHASVALMRRQHEETDRAQLMLYAAMYLHNLHDATDEQTVTQPDHILLRIRYVHLVNEEETLLEWHVGEEEILAFLDESLQRFCSAQASLHDYRRQRNELIRNAKFPYQNWRQGQRQLAEEGWRVMHQGKHLLAQAPTGTGKSLATLFSAAAAIASGPAEQILYTTARNTGAQAAHQALVEMAQGDQPLRWVTLTAREAICPHPGTACDPDVCQYAAGFYDRITGAVEAAIERRAMSAATIREVADLHQVCPFELSLELTTECDVVVCDYNYIFDPVVQIARLLPLRDKSVLLVDEVHQLPERLRAMHRASLHAETLDSVVDAFSASWPADVARCLANVQQCFKQIADNAVHPGSNGVAACVSVPQDHLARLIEALGMLMEAYSHWRAAGAQVDVAGIKHADAPEHQENLFAQMRHSAAPDQGVGTALSGAVEAEQFWFEWWRFVTIYEELQHSPEGSWHGYYDPESAELVLCLAIVEAVSAGNLQQFHASTLFSATAMPQNWLSTELGMEAEMRTCAVPSPFRAEQMAVLAVTELSTFYPDREKTADDIASVIDKVVAGRNGNYLLLAPSFAYLALLMDRVMELCPMPQADWQQAKPGMSLADKRTFMRWFESQRRQTHTRLAGAVLGGPFAESIDLKGDALHGVIVVGLGLPPRSYEREVRVHAFDMAGKHATINDRSGSHGDVQYGPLPTGRRLAYEMPAIQKVLQGAGRLIRSEKDCGILCLIDPRYGKIRGFFPEHWDTHQIPVVNVEEAVRTFWNRQSEGRGGAPEASNTTEST